jgi:crotonobetainyl-CoA:carnitine CoA-transferase CaiB-like acyl-CoA transferase
VAGKLPQKQGSAHPNIAPYGDVFKTADGQEVLLAIGSDRQFEDLCRVLGISELSGDPKFKTNPARVVNRDALKSVLQAAIDRFTSGVLMASINESKIPAGIIQNIKQVFEMKEAEALLIQSGGLTGVRSYIARSDHHSSSHVLLPPPHFGEHTQEVLDTLIN